LKYGQVVAAELATPAVMTVLSQQVEVAATMQLELLQLHRVGHIQYVPAVHGHVVNHIPA
jgi:spore coat protein CotF